MSASPRARSRTGPAGSLLVLALLAGCGGGRYGFSRTYSPLAVEQTHFEKAQQPTYQDLIREPDKYKNIEIGWFGVVTDIRPLEGGRVRLVLSLRAHQARHLCSDDSSSSCRVTVSESSLGPFTAEVTLKPSDLEGKERVWLGSLLKIYGTYTGEYSEETGPVLAVSYYRHWPRGYYVTTAQRGAMRR